MCDQCDAFDPTEHITKMSDPLGWTSHVDRKDPDSDGFISLGTTGVIFDCPKAAFMVTAEMYAEAGCVGIATEYAGEHPHIDGDIHVLLGVRQDSPELAEMIETGSPKPLKDRPEFVAHIYLAKYHFDYIKASMAEHITERTLAEMEAQFADVAVDDAAPDDHPDDQQG